MQLIDIFLAVVLLYVVHRTSLVNEVWVVHVTCDNHHAVVYILTVPESIHTGRWHIH
jgi:hypothetical protein